MANNRNDYGPNLASDIVQTAEAKQRRQTSFDMTDSAQYLQRPAKPTQQCLAISRMTVTQTHCRSTHSGVRTGNFAFMVRTEVRNLLREAGASLGGLPVMKSYGCQVLVSTVVSTVLQCFPLVGCWIAKTNPMNDPMKTTMC